jgi:sugar phosphate isomerase/epimerase
MFYSGFADEAGTPIEEQIKAQKTLGWKHIELRMVPEGNATEVPDAVFDKALAALNAAGIKISSFGSPIANWARNIDQNFQQDIESLRRAVPRMKKAGCSIIRIMSWPNSTTKPLADADWGREVLKRLKVLVKMAEDGGVVLGMENCSGWSGDNPVNMKKTLETIKSPALRVIYDTGNVVAHPGGAWEWYEACKPYTVYVHIKDGVPPDAKGEHYTWPGEGKGMVQEVLKDLFASKYDGGFSIEPHLAAQVHKGTTADGKANAFDMYVEYGRRVMKLVEEAKKK